MTVQTATPMQATDARLQRTFDARDLMPDGQPVRILLDDQTYYLRITRAGKLILTK